MRSYPIQTIFWMSRGANMNLFHTTNDAYQRQFHQATTIQHFEDDYIVYLKYH